MPGYVETLEADATVKNSYKRKEGTTLIYVRYA